MRRAAPWLVFLALSACGTEATPIARVDARIRLEHARRVVHPGEGFLLRVVRTWRRGFEPSPWEDALLSPLVLRAEGIERREDERHIEETRRFRAYAFSRKDVRVPSVPFLARPKDGSEVRLAASRPWRLGVRPEVDPKQPGMPEGPGPLPRAPRSVWAYVLAAVLALAVALVWWWRRRLRSVFVPASAAPPPPETEALARLRALGEARPAAGMIAVADVVRGFVGTRFGVAAEARTTEELARVAPVAGVLGACDRVKFAREVPSREALHETLEAASALVRGTVS